jgi:hypothetical protein
MAYFPSNVSASRRLSCWKVWCRGSKVGPFTAQRISRMEAVWRNSPVHSLARVEEVARGQPPTPPTNRGGLGGRERKRKKAQSGKVWRRAIRTEDMVSDHERG